MRKKINFLEFPDYLSTYLPTLVTLVTEVTVEKVVTVVTGVIVVTEMTAVTKKKLDNKFGMEKN